MCFGEINNSAFFYIQTKNLENVISLEMLLLHKQCYNKVDESIKYCKILSHKSTSFVDVHAMGKNLYE